MAFHIHPMICLSFCCKYSFGTIFYISRLEMYIPRLETYIPSLEIYIPKLEMYIPRLEI